MWTAMKKENGLNRLCGGFVRRIQTDPGQVFVKFLVLILFLEESDLNLKWSLNKRMRLVQTLQELKCMKRALTSQTKHRHQQAQFLLMISYLK